MTSDPRAPGAAAVYLFREEVADDPHHFKTVYARVKILTEAGKELATVHVNYQKNFIFNASGNNSSRMGASSNHWDAPDMSHAGEDAPNDPDSFNVHTEVTAIEGRTIHPDGSIVPLTGAPADLLKVKKGKNEVNDLSFTLPSAEVGSILEYRYQVRYDRFNQAPNWQIQQPFFVHRAHYSFTPAEKFSPERNKNQGSASLEDSALRDIHGEVMTDIRYAPVLPPGANVKWEAAGRYTLDMTDVPPIPHEPFSPALESQVYQVAFFYTPTPDEKEFWQKEMGYWNKALSAYIAPTPALHAAANEAVAPTDSQLDKAKKLFAFVQRFENIDFTDDGEPGIFSDWVPSGHVDKVIEDHKGTSNQIAYLYLALARAAGLNARPQRIASRSHRLFSVHFLRTDQLDSVVIALNIDGKQITVDPGTRMTPFESMHWAHAGAGGIELNSNGKVETVITPLQKSTENNIVRIGTLTVNPQGVISGTVKLAFTGQEALQLRQLAIKSGEDAVRARITNMLASQLPDGVQPKVERVAKLDDPDKQLVAVVPVSGSLTTTGTRVAVPRLFFRKSEINPFPEVQSRTQPLDVGYPSQEQDQITYVLPAGYCLEGTPQDAKIAFQDNAVYQLHTKVEGSSIVNSRILARGFTVLDARNYGELRDFYQKVIAADQQQLVLAAAKSSGQ